MILKLNTKTSKSFPKGELITPQNKGDAGYDIKAVSEPKIEGDLWTEDLYKRIDYIEYETNISIEPEVDDLGEYNFFSLLFPRSSISKYNLSLCNSVGVIDSGYRDSIKVRFNYIAQPENYYFLSSEGQKKHNLLVSVDKTKIYKKGDKIAQLCFSKHMHPKIFLNKKLNKSSRDLGGFGSTGE